MSEERPQQQLLAIRSPNHRIIYVDAFSFRTTAVDCSLICAAQTTLSVPGPQGNTNQVNALQEEVTLAMPLPTLKALFLHLQMIVKAVETEIGPIRIIQSMRATDANFEIVKQGLKSNPLVTAE
jgi:hypothetical protein